MEYSSGSFIYRDPPRLNFAEQLAAERRPGSFSK